MLSFVMLRRKGDVYQQVLRIVPQGPAQSHRPSARALPSSPIHLQGGRSATPAQIRNSITATTASAIGASGAGRHGYWRVPTSGHNDLCRHHLHTSAPQQSSTFASLQRFSTLSSQRSTGLRANPRQNSHQTCHCIRHQHHYHHNHHNHHHHCQHHHHSRLHSATPGKRLRSTYDPELAACMDRWIRIAFTGQKRMQSSLVKPMPAPSTVTYSVVDIANSVSVGDSFDSVRTPRQCDDPARPDASTSVSVTSAEPGEGATLSANKKVMALRKSLRHIPIEDFDPPLPFISLSEPGWRRKPMFSKTERKAVDRVWHQYLKLVRGDYGGDMSKQDYTTLMRTVRHSWDPKEGAARILTLHAHIYKEGILMTRKMIEMGIQAHIVLGSMPEAVRLYHEVGRIAGEGSVEQRRVLEVMLDGFNTNQLELDGITFLENFPACLAADFKPILNFQHLYQRLLSDQLRSLGGMDASLKSIAAIKRFLRSPIPPRLLDVRRVLWVLGMDSDSTRLVYDFSRRFSGLLVKTADAKAMTPLLQSILSSCHVQEAARVLDLMLIHGMEPELEEIRLYLLRNLAKGTADKEEVQSVIAQWDLMALQRIRQPLGTTDLVSNVQHNDLDLDLDNISQYARLLSKCIKKDDIPGALNVASYIHMRGWSTSELDFKQLNSHMVNYGRSNAFVDYLDVRYTLGGISKPDLHTFRRLIYAACRRSDLYSALSLFKLLRVRHIEWFVDASIYNAIISTAGATGHIRVAERTFRCLLEDGVQPDRSSFHGLLNGYTNAKDLEAAVLIPEQMVKHKLTPTTRTFNLIMKAYLGTRCDLATARKLFRVMQLSGHSAAPPDLVTFNQLLEAYRRVGNTQWFDAYFDRVFGQSPQNSVSPQSLPSVSSSLTTPAVDRTVATDASADIPAGQVTNDGNTSKTTKASRRAKVMPIRPGSSDDKTLLIQLKHSLLLPNIDLPTIWELWHAIAPKFESQPTDAAATAIVSDTTTNAAPTLTSLVDDAFRPKTHVPFKKRMGDLSVPATDSDHFRFTTLTLFKAAFRSRGDLSGVKQMDRILSDLFPNHPMGQAVIAKQGIKRSRVYAKTKSANS